MQWLAIALGGALGAMLRFAATSYLAPFHPVTSIDHRFPVGTFIVNVSGSFLIGIAYVLLVEKTTLPIEWRLFFMTGILGGYTTFSAFSLEVLQLWQDGNVFTAMAYASCSVFIGLMMTFTGMLLAQKLF